MISALVVHGIMILARIGLILLFDSLDDSGFEGFEVNSIIHLNHILLHANDDGKK